MIKIESFVAVAHWTKMFVIQFGPNAATIATIEGAFCFVTGSDR